jgi:HEPN superfamily AbiU2-like protein
MNANARAARWVAWLDTIWNDVIPMMAARQIWRGYMHLIRANPPVETPGTFHSWVTSNYARTQAIGIRRQTDVRTDVVSLGRLLPEVEQFPRVVSRARYVALYSPNDIDSANRDFDTHVGAGRDHLDPADVARDRARLAKSAQPVRHWVDKQVAHWDQGQFTDTITLAEIHRSLDDVIDLADRYRTLLTASAMVRRVVLSAWESVLTRGAWQVPSGWNRDDPPPVN